MLEVVINGPLIVLQECVGVAQAVAGLGLHGLVLQKPGQLQSPPGGRKQRRRKRRKTVKECRGRGAGG